MPLPSVHWVRKLRMCFPQVSLPCFFFLLIIMPCPNSHHDYDVSLAATRNAHRILEELCFRTTWVKLTTPHMSQVCVCEAMIMKDVLYSPKSTNLEHRSKDIIKFVWVSLQFQILPSGIWPNQSRIGWICIWPSRLCSCLGCRKRWSWPRQGWAWCGFFCGSKKLHYWFFLLSLLSLLSPPPL